MFDIFRKKPHNSSPTPRDAEGQLPVPDYDEELSSYYSRITSELTRVAGLLDEDKAERIAREREYQRELAEEIRRRTEFLEKTESAPASPELYALWLYAYMARGRRVTHPRDRNFPQSHIEKGDSITEKVLATIGPNGPTFEDRTISHYDQPLVWTPTKSSDNHKTSYTIPTGHGANSMEILYLPDLVTLNPCATSGDRRPGREYGHSTLLTLRLDDTSPTGFYATTNQPDTVESYIDTIDLIMGVSGGFDPEIMRSKIQQLQHENTDDGWSELLSC